MDFIFGISSDILFLTIVFASALAAGLVRGVQIVSEIGIALVVASFLSTLSAGKLLVPNFIQALLGILPVPIEATFFLLMLAFSFWAVRHSTSGIDDTKRFPKVAMAAAGVALLSAFVVTRVVPMSSIFTFGPFLGQFVTGESSLLFVLLAGITALAFSRKV
jgi:hypothetical protein